MKTIAHLQQTGLDVPTSCIELLYRGEVKEQSLSVKEQSLSVGQPGGDQNVMSSKDGNDQISTIRKAKTNASKSCWSSYESIENCDNSHFLSLVLAANAASELDVEWVATEKVHGANFSFETDGELVEYASRVHKLGVSADFYNARSTMPKYHPFVLEAFRLAKLRWPEVKRMVIYGEYFGGWYPGLKTAGLKKVQGGVAYSPDHHFYAFDMLCDSFGYVDFDECREILVAAGFPLVMTPLARGTLPEVLAFDVETLCTSIPAQLGHPPVNQFQVAEGIVIRPTQILGSVAGRRAVLKKKARAFWEATNQHGILAKKAVIAEDNRVVGPEGLAIETVGNLITVNRLRAVISKDADLLEQGKLPKLNGMLAKDVLDDFAKLHADVLDKKGLATVKKATQYMVRRFVEEHIKGIREDVG